MVRIVFNSTDKTIVTIVEHTPNMGTTYTTDNIIVCDELEAVDYFSDYPEHELSKLTTYIDEGTELLKNDKQIQSEIQALFSLAEKTYNEHYKEEKSAKEIVEIVDQKKI